MLGILPKSQAKYILLQNGPSYWDRNVCVGLHRTTRIRSLLVSLQGTHLPLRSACSVFANSKSSLQAHNLGRRGAEHSNFREYREQKVSFRCLAKMQRGAYMNFMGSFSWMVCVSMLKIGYVFQWFFFFIMWIAVWDIIFHVKRSQQSLEKDQLALV